MLQLSNKLLSSYVQVDAEIWWGMLGLNNRYKHSPPRQKYRSHYQKRRGHWLLGAHAGDVIAARMTDAS